MHVSSEIFLNVYNLLQAVAHLAHYQEASRNYKEKLLNVSLWNKKRTRCHLVLYLLDRGSTMVKVLCYKSEGRWFDPSWCHWIFH